MDIIPAGMPADDLQTAIQETQATLQHAVDKLPKRDPICLMLAAQSAVLDIFGRSTHRWERATADVIAARSPITADDRAAIREVMEQGAYNGMRKEAQRMLRTLDRRLSVQIGLSVAGAFVLGAVSVLCVVAVTQHNATTEAARWQSWWIATCAEKSPRRVVVDGKLVCQVPIDMAAGK